MKTDQLVGGIVEINAGKLTSTLNAAGNIIDNITTLRGQSGDYTLGILGRRTATFPDNAITINTYNSLNTSTARIQITGGVNVADVKIVNSYLVATAYGIRTYKDEGDYGGAFTTYTPPTAKEGLIVLARDTNLTTPGWRLYACFADGWHYVDLT